MHKFEWVNPYNEQEPRKVTIEVGQEADLTEMLEAFESYLQAIGYSFDGNIDIVPEHSFDDSVRSSHTEDMTGTGQYIFGRNYSYHDHGDLSHDSYYPNDYDVKVTYGKNK